MFGAFSDGVFAIAITLLVLNIEVPDVPGSDLGSAIADLSQDLVAYGIGFAVIGLFWFEHHKLFASLGRASGRLVVVNTALLALIALMPFTTAVLGRTTSRSRSRSMPATSASRSSSRD